MQYGQQAADEMQAKETLFKNFFQNVEVVMRQHSTVHTSKWAVSTLCWPCSAFSKGISLDARTLCTTASRLCTVLKSLVLASLGSVATYMCCSVKPIY